MRTSVFAAVVFGLLALVGASVQASEQLNAKDLKARFLIEVPGYWALSKFKVEASANYGTEVEPLFKHRFTAEVELQTDTFLLDGKEGPVTWLVPVAKAGEKRTVYGIATSRLSTGAWQTEFALENNPMVRVGQPRDFFSGRVVVRGTDEEARYREELARPTLIEAQLRHQEELARRKREEELKEQERQAEINRLASEARLREERRKFKEQEATARKAEEQELLRSLAEGAKNQLATKMPGYWKVTAFDVDEAVKTGTVDQPVYAQNFSAELELTKDTFAEVERDGPVVFITPVASAGETRSLYGVVRSTFESGAWTSVLEFENDPSEGMGAPIGFFSGRVLVKGSPEDDEYRRAQRNEELSRLRREEAIREQERQAELARLAHEEKLREQERQAELAKLAYTEKVDEAERQRREKEEAVAKAEREALLNELADSVKTQLAIKVPGYWTVAAFDVQERSAAGTVVKQRFMAEVELEADTFVLDRKEGAVTWVTPVAKAGEKRTVYGVSTSRLGDGVWQTELALENNPMARVGQPRDFFSGQVIARGTEEETRYLETLAKARQAEAQLQHEEELARLRREEELKEQERKAQLAKLTYQEDVSEAERRRREQEEAATKAEQEALLRDLAGKAKSQLAVNLPGYWSITSFEVQETAISGPEDQPVIQQAFASEIVLAKDTFAAAEKEGPVVFVTPVAREGERRTVYGVATAAVEAGTWQSKLELQNDPPAVMGRPIDYFSGRVIVKGSAEEEEYQNRKYKEQEAKRKREERLRELDRQAELASARHAQQLEAERQKVELAKLEFEEKLREEKRKREERKVAKLRELKKRKIAEENKRRTEKVIWFRNVLSKGNNYEIYEMIKTSLEGKDKVLQELAFTAALDSTSRDLKQLGLAYLLARVETLSVTSKLPREQWGVNKIQFAIKIREFNRITGSFTGVFLGGDLDAETRKQQIKGVLSGTTLSAYNDYCSLTVDLKGRDAMDGRFSCPGRKGVVRLSGWDGSARIPLPSKIFVTAK